MLRALFQNLAEPDKTFILPVKYEVEKKDNIVVQPEMLDKVCFILLL